MHVRGAVSGDNEALQSLQARCPMGTNLIVSTINTPDFFARARAYENYQVFVACEGDEIIGSAACAVRDAMVNGELRRVGYEFQAFTSPEHRRQGVAARLHQSREEYVREQGAVLSYTLIMEGNAPALSYIGNQGFRWHRTLVMPGLAVYRPMEPTTSARIRPAAISDLGRIADLLNETWQGHELYEPTSADRLARFIERTPAYELGNIRVLEDEGDILACLGYWDWTKVTELTVLQLSRGMRFVSLMLNMARLFRPMPRSVRRGDRMTQMVLTPIAYKQPGHLSPLLAHLNNEGLERGINVMFCICEYEHPMLGGLKGFIRVDTAMHILAKTFAVGASLGDGPVFVDGIDL